MNLVRTLVIVSLVTTFLISGSAFADKGGNGGGGVEINGKIYTLTQAGLKLPPLNNQDPYFLDKDTIDAALAVISAMEAAVPGINQALLPGKLIGFFRKGLVDSRHSYQRAQVADPKLYKKIRDEYQKYVNTLPIQGKFVLGASTDQSGMTTLYPDFFLPRPLRRLVRSG